MTREDIIRMAREASIAPQYTRSQDAIVRKGHALSGELKGYRASVENLERFAALVAEHERAAEREAICKLADNMLRTSDAVALIDAIRARGK